MDRSWIFSSQPFSPEFLKGVKQFMEHVKARYSADEKIKCPCRKCLNHIEKSLDDVHEDIEINGMSRCYTRWVYHGEEEIDVGQDEVGEEETDVGQDERERKNMLLYQRRICHGKDMMRDHFMRNSFLKMS
jgi:hypothetical protein